MYAANYTVNLVWLLVILAIIVCVLFILGRGWRR